MRTIGSLLALAGALAATDIASAQPLDPVPSDIRTAVYQDSAAADREALEALYHAAGGPDWNDRTNWLSAAPLGEWFGVVTDSNGRVTSLALPGNGLSGEIPPALGRLASLRRLDLGARWVDGVGWADNDLNGAIPPELGGLTNLRGLHLRDNDLSGEIPPELGDLTNLQELDLRFNDLSGEIPPELGDLTNLERLDLWGSELSGEIPPELGDLSNLQELHLQSNGLSGEIPPELATLTNLKVLNLWFNELSGVIPPELANLTNLQELYLGHNELSGVIPPELANLTNLQKLYLGFNELNGVIPPELATLSNLEWLGLRFNELVGAIPPELGDLTNLEGLDLERNELSGTIPPELGNLTNLGWLSLESNELSGAIPPELGDLSNLRELTLGDNELVGAIPPELAALTKLYKLDLEDNELVGAIPPELSALTKLQELYLGGNRLNGKIPRELMQLSELRRFDISRTDVCVPADDEFQAWLATIDDFRSTRIACDGSLRVAFSTSSYVVREGGSVEVTVRLIDQTNGPAPSATIPLTVTPGGGAASQDYAGVPERVTITAPASTGTFVVTAVEDGHYDHAETITLGFRRPLPSGVTAGSPDTATVTIIDPGTASMTDREVLEALYEATGGPEWKNRTNWLSEVPLGKWLGVVTDRNGRLTSLTLPGNGLSGSIPPPLGRLASLQRLDLGGNELSGAIPPEMGDLTNLQWLDLASNELSGAIPPELGNLTNLKELDLGDNELSGAIPPELGRLASLQRLDLGSPWDSSSRLYRRGNELSGQIPPELGDLSNLQVLYLGANELSGVIPPELADLSNLYVLDLGGNELKGEIPTELADLSNLRVLYLLNNDLSGEIPPELADLSNLQVLRLRHNELSGAIPTELADLSKLYVLDLLGNELSGEIPPELTSLSNLRDLNLGGNDLSGEIPPELADLSNLQVLFLWGNELSGEIPRELGELTNLQVLRLGVNELSGEIPPELADLTNLEVLSLASNDLSGEIPPELGDLTNLLWLTLADNQLSGSIPPELGGMTNLGELDLESNELSGSIPPELGNLANLVYLSLWGNELSGSIPPELANLTKLLGLHIGFNPNLNGTIPRQFLRLKLPTLNLMATRVCLPSDNRFQQWLAAISNFTPSGAICGSLPEEMTSIDVAVFYTPAARSRAGGAAEIEAQIDLFVAETNQAYEDGGVNQRIVLVAAEEVPYVEENASGHLAIHRLAQESDDYMNEVHAIRDRVGADLVHLIAEVTDVGGIAYPEGAFAITCAGCSASVFAHELGHNMGLSHDRYVDFGRLPYSYGYVNQRAFEEGAPESSRWRTIMAYANQCEDANFDYSCARIMRFSNPNQSYLGDPLGVPGKSRTSAVNGPADAVRALNITRHSVAAFRPRSQDTISRAQSGGKQASRPPPAAGAPSGGLFTAISTPKHRVAESDPKALRRREVAVDIRHLAQAPADRPTALPLNLFDDVMLTGVIAKRTPTYSGGYALTGPLFGIPGGTVALVVNGEVVAGTVRLPGATYRIRPAGAGRHTIVQVDPSQSSWRCGTEPWRR